ncbi:MAG TPA: type IV pili twitching motility protein PilT [Elusimicrobia bacterium]|nr:MAG: type IV pili twitching motility protein PilT [Elusimicrobia bacterium GWA2_66_18]OGR68983.1 MAG: type IV pili twitching motility protein PilT [Elusimicrobia bacterium GWC2_65_9]HAZ08277.1 type IV pili twitching motility protein PilT [Elusimicrobiota bacterium]
MELVEILKVAAQTGASDIHLVIGKPPLMRLNGEIGEIPGFSKISAEESKRLVYSILYEEQRAKFEENWELDCSFAVSGLARFRVNVLLQKNGVEAVMRVINSKIPTPEQLRLSKSITDLADLPRGLVLVTGPTGSGKSTTLATVMEIINTKYSDHILTIEDPIEFVYESKKAIFRQREIGQNTKSFAAALKSALRQDPDVILIGEMRDLETIQLAITAAETGHLCFGTLHTQDAPSTIDRIIDVFPTHQQTQVRVQLAVVLQAVVCQQLLTRRDGEGRLAAREIMIMTPAISNLIREGKTHMIYGAIDTGAKHGMVPMDKALAELVRQGLVHPEEALTRAGNPETFKQLAGITGRSGASLM